LPRAQGDSDVEDDNDGHHLEAAVAALDGIEPFDGQEVAGVVTFSDDEEVAGVASDDEGADGEVEDSDNGEE
jgi:hypothetical protein